VSYLKIKIRYKNLRMQRFAEGFNSGVKGLTDLRYGYSSVIFQLKKYYSVTCSGFALSKYSLTSSGFTVPSNHCTCATKCEPRKWKCKLCKATFIHPYVVIICQLKWSAFFAVIYWSKTHQEQIFVLMLSEIFYCEVAFYIPGLLRIFMFFGGRDVVSQV
jgi:hypothetical protein